MRLLALQSQTEVLAKQPEPKLATDVAGVVVLLFLAGLVPFSSLIFLLLAMCALSSYIQYNTLVRQELERQSAPTGTPGLQAPFFMHPEHAHHADVLSSMGTLSLQQLRLSLMNRDFDESGIQATCNTLQLVLVAGLHKTCKHQSPLAALADISIGWRCQLKLLQSSQFYTLLI